MAKRGRKAPDAGILDVRIDAILESENCRMAGDYDGEKMHLARAAKILEEVSQKTRDRVIAEEKIWDQLIFDVEKLAEFFGLPSWEKIEESNLDYIWESARISYKEKHRYDDDDGDDASPQEAADADSAREEEMNALEDEVRNDLFQTYQRAVFEAADKLFDEAGMDLMPFRFYIHTEGKRSSERPFEWRLQPTTDSEETFLDGDRMPVADGWRAVGKLLYDEDNDGSFESFDEMAAAVVPENTAAAWRSFVVANLGSVTVMRASGRDAKRLFDGAWR